jgi:hypothetical protein
VLLKGVASSPLERLAADFIQDLAGLQVGHNAQFEYRPTCGLVSSSRPARPAELLGVPCYLLSTTRPFTPLLPLSEPRLSPGLRFLRASPSGSERLG